MPYNELLKRNRQWVAEQLGRDPHYFERLASVHEPEFLWIGCSDARVPANEITGTLAGEMFVHRNIANQVIPSDPNLGAVLQFAIDVLKVKDIIVCGHEECGGIRAVLGGGAPSQVDAWLTAARMVARLHAKELASIPPNERVRRLVELNTIEQVHQLTETPAVKSAWARGQELRLHGWVFGLGDGLLRDLGVTRSAPEPD